MKVESINEALRLIIGKADQGMYGEADAKTMCYEILEVAKQVYNKSPESPVEALEVIEKKVESKYIYALNIMYECLQDAPVDFLGTGSNSMAAFKEEEKWNKRWNDAYEVIMSNNQPPPQSKTT